ncbi:hypothetical protein WR25_19184 [Diploscapter pachys]|uniref:Glutaredoxin domain-containing protein n=1 Tax=Diploscapter pachys TaxID=2018661 RepID=A0A2A2JF80_9BILA|nr:hypothetical protein WR25_19184 [Diploscapter pachys]
MGNTQAVIPKKPAISASSLKVLEEARQAAVVMFTKDGCGYCTMAKDILNDEGIPYVEKNLSVKAKEDPDNFEKYMNGLINLTKSRTVPQIFLCGKFIGGCTDLNSSRSNLKLMLQNCSADGGKTLKPDWIEKHKI